MSRMSFSVFALFILVSIASKTQAFEISRALAAPIIDGVAEDSAWDNINWRPIDQIISGVEPSADDFSGRYKLVWMKDHLYMIAEIVDDVLLDKHANPLQNYWEDDALEILIDENASGGDHLNNYNAFAYHIALDNQIVDVSEDGTPKLFNDHIRSVWQRDINTGKVIWELAISIYNDQFQLDQQKSENKSQPIELTAGKTLGLMIAYCDADALDGRQNFITSWDIEAVDGTKNRAYIDASVFEPVTLVD